MGKLTYSQIKNKSIDDYLNYVVNGLNDELLLYGDGFTMSRKDFNKEIIESYLQEFLEDIVYMIQQGELDYLFYFLQYKNVKSSN